MAWLVEEADSLFVCLFGLFVCLVCLFVWFVCLVCLFGLFVCCLFCLCCLFVVRTFKQQIEMKTALVGKD